jgi:hypothetical protein
MEVDRVIAFILIVGKQSMFITLRETKVILNEFSRDLMQSGFLGFLGSRVLWK